jgi:hypothetical protein
MASIMPEMFSASLYVGIQIRTFNVDITQVEIEDAEREYVNIDQSATMTNIQQQQTILATCNAWSDSSALPG